MDVVSVMEVRRRELNMTQVELAEKSGLPQSTISLIESGKYTPNLRILASLAQILKVSEDDLLKSYEEYIRERV